jgi:acyl carrier protein
MSQTKIDQVVNIVQRATKNFNVDENSSMQNTEGWDSLAYLAILQELEDTFNLVLSPKNINSFGSVKEIIENLNE